MRKVPLPRHESELLQGVKLVLAVQAGVYQGVVEQDLARIGFLHCTVRLLMHCTGMAWEMNVLPDGSLALPCQQVCRMPGSCQLQYLTSIALMSAVTTDSSSQ